MNQRAFPMFVYIVVNILSSKQEVKVQERSEDVPVGHIPRSLTVQVKGGLTRTMRSRSFAILVHESISGSIGIAYLINI